MDRTKRRMHILLLLLICIISLSFCCYECNEISANKKNVKDKTIEITSKTKKNKKKDVIKEEKKEENIEDQIETENLEEQNIVEEQIVVEEPIETIYEPVEYTEPVETVESTNSNSLGVFKITAYCPCSLCCGEYASGLTASGTIATANRTIAVDTSMIPLGSQVVINGNTYIAEDTGGAINGNRIDIFMGTHEEALNFGVQYLEVFTTM